MTKLNEVSFSNEVFEAFIDPSITTKFWFTKSSGRLEEGKRFRWDWEMYGVSKRLRLDMNCLV